MSELEALAVRLAANPDHELEQAFEALLARVVDVEVLRDLAQRFTPHREVSIPAYKRLLEVKPQDVGAIAALGFVFFLEGEDELAWLQVEAGEKLDPVDVELLTLKAALVKDTPVKVALYKKILELEPTNRVAIENLKALGVD